MPTTTARPRAPRQPIAVPMPAAVPETSNATSAPAPSVQSVDPGRGVLGEGVDGREPERVDDLATKLVRLEDDDLGSDRARDVRDQQADRAGSDDDGVLARDEPGAAHVVHRDCGRLGQRRGLQREVCRAGGRARPPARSSATASTRARRSPERPADSRCARRRSARSAGTARDERHDRRRVADCPVLDAVADRRDAAGHLVAEHRGHRHPRVHRAVEDVEVGAADPVYATSSCTSPGAGGATSVSTTSSAPLPM